MQELEHSGKQTTVTETTKTSTTITSTTTTTTAAAAAKENNKINIITINNNCDVNKISTPILRTENFLNYLSSVIALAVILPKPYI
jgi:Tfp pilus assembly major pilin PilA